MKTACFHQTYQLKLAQNCIILIQLQYPNSSAIQIIRSRFSSETAMCRSSFPLNILETSDAAAPERSAMAF
jgi:hypothetical protein